MVAVCPVIIRSQTVVGGNVAVVVRVNCQQGECAAQLDERRQHVATAVLVLSTITAFRRARDLLHLIASRRVRLSVTASSGIH